MTTSTLTHVNELAAGRRAVTLKVPGMSVSDGAGVKLTRVLGTPALPRLDPFLLLDMFYSDQPQDYLAGFPDHPHRGFETVTYVLAGKVRHEDSKGHVGVVKPGGVQWMTAGRGIVHSEMPEQTEGLLWGFQLWLNLPAVDKMTEPRYQEFDADAVAVEQRDSGTQVRVIAGQTSLGTQGPIQPGATEPIYLDVALTSDGYFSEPLPETHNSFILVYDGQVTVLADTPEQVQTIKAGTLAVLGKEGRLDISTASSPGQFLLIAGRPLNEPVVQSGPFVMNTQAELLQAYRDFQTGQF